MRDEYAELFADLQEEGFWDQVYLFWLYIDDKVKGYKDELTWGQLPQKRRDKWRERYERFLQDERDERSMYYENR